MIDSTISNATIEDDSKVHVVGTGMDAKAPNSIWLELIDVLVVTAPSASTALEDVRLDVKVEVVDVTKATIMEKLHW